jgi:hypothetical protein
MSKSWCQRFRFYQTLGPYGYFNLNAHDKVDQQEMNRDIVITEMNIAA